MKWNFYDSVNGAFLGCSFSGPENSLAANSPSRSVAMPAGDYVAHLKSLNVGTGKLEDWQPPQPDEAAVQRKMQKIRVRRDIANLEVKQARALREHSLGQDGARERLESIDNEIATLRAQLNG